MIESVSEKWRSKIQKLNDLKIKNLIFPVIFLHFDFWNISLDSWYKHPMTILWEKYRMRYSLSLSISEIDYVNIK